MQMKARGTNVAAAYASMARGVAIDALSLSTAQAMTDVTGFGLAGHLANICRASGVGAELNVRDVPLLNGALAMSETGVQSSLYPDNLSDALTMMNAPQTARGRLMLDPQTAGGLLAALSQADAKVAIATMKERGIDAIQIGKIVDGPVALNLIE
jgi:selenide,water dikinase